MIEGKPVQVARARHTANTAVLPGRTSTRSRPSAHLTDESEEVDGRVMRESPALLERLDDGLDVIHYGTKFTRVVAFGPRRRCVSGALSVHPPMTSRRVLSARLQTAHG